MAVVLFTSLVHRTCAMRKSFLFGILCVLCCFFSLSTFAQGNQITIKPARCIALHEGQVCYQTLRIEWFASTADHFCVKRRDSDALLMCWENSSRGQFQYEFSANTKTEFVLIRKQDAQALATAVEEVAWVYNASSRRESHWRVF